MKRLCFLLVLLMPLAGCAGFDNCSDSCSAQPRVNPYPAGTCGNGAISQTSANLPAQTAEPPVGAGR